MADIENSTEQDRDRRRDEPTAAAPTGTQPPQRHPGIANPHRTRR